MITGYLSVGQGHTLYWEQHGAEQGLPAVVLHGGPGGGLSREHLKFFDLKRYRVTLFDQRGCGKSTPFGSLQHNTTMDLVRDIERLRTHLGIDTWVVLGGSWGSTLGLVYAETHPSNVTALILRSVCLLTAQENRWLYEPGGASEVFPTEYEAFRTPIQRSKTTTLKAYRKLLTHKNAKTRKQAARAWWDWEAAVSFLKQRPDPTTDKEAVAIARIENHYFLHGAWLKPNQLLKNAKRLTMPVHLVHGRYDMICPVKSAFALKAQVPHAQLHVIPDAGHAGAEPGTKAMLRQITGRLVQTDL
jgi:proline iminopeptidase